MNLYSAKAGKYQVIKLSCNKNTIKKLNKLGIYKFSKIEKLEKKTLKTTLVLIEINGKRTAIMSRFAKKVIIEEKKPER